MNSPKVQTGLQMIHFSLAQGGSVSPLANRSASSKVLSWLNSKAFRFLAVLFTLILGHTEAWAFHIMGGSMTYKYIGVTGSNYQYEVTVDVYADRTGNGWNLGNPNDPASGNPVQLSFTAYSRVTNQSLLTRTFQSPGSPETSISFAAPELPAGCVNIACLNSYVVTKSTATFTVTLPIFENGSPNFTGYYFLYSNRARNAGIINLQNSAALGVSMYQTVPEPQYQNSSPQFTDSAVPVMFSNDTAYFINSCFDPDGDRLVYSLTSALDATGNNNPPTWITPQNVTYNPVGGYSATTPMGSTGFASIDASTGLTKYFTPTPGKYVCAIAVQEYRRLSNGTEVPLGTTRRELQIVVLESGNQAGQCPLNQTPVQIGSFPTQYTITQGQSVSFNVQYRDPDLNNVALTATGNIVSGANGYTGPRATFNPLNGTLALGTFTWNTNCNVPANTYAINITAKDDGCLPKQAIRTVNITVLKFTGPTAIVGSTNTCSSNNLKYYVNGAASGITRQWKITGGTIVATSPNVDTVTVRWNTGNGTLRLVSTNSIGCKDSVTANVTAAAVNPVVASNNTTICAGTTSTLTATGGTGTFNWTTLAGTSVGSGSSITVAPATTTSYVVTSTSGSCSAKDTVVVTVIPKVAASSDVVACGRYEGRVGPTTVTGYTYSWNSVPGVTYVDPVTTSNPRILVTASGTYQLILTATQTSSNCQSKDTVLVTVRALPKPPAFTDSTICSGATVVLGVATAETGITYLWGNTTGFVSGGASQARPSVLLTNNGTSTLVVKYPITATNSSTSCVRTDTVYIRVRPRPTETVQATYTTCSNTNLTIGTTAVTGNSYSWSPATLLSASNVANPVFNDPTASINPVVRNYTLTITTAAGCQFTYPVAVTVNGRPTANAGLDKTVCEGVATTLGTAGTNGVTYSWSPTTGLSNATVAQPNLTLTGATGSVQTFQYIVTATNTANSCIARDTVVVTLQPAAVANAGTDVTACSNAPVTLGSAGLPSYTYSWSPTTNLTGPTTAQPTFRAVNNGTSPVTTRYIITATNTLTGCTKNDTVNVTVNPAGVGSRFTTTFCSGSPTTIGPAPQANFTYSWTPANLFVNSTVAQPVLLNSTNTGNTPIVLNLFRTATNTVNSCVTQDTVVVTINPLPAVSAGVDKTVCEGVATTIGAAATTGVTYSWSPVTGLSNATTAQPNLTLTGATNSVQTFRYIVTATTTATNCSAKDTVVITLQPAAIANAGPDATACSNAPITIGTAGLANYTYSWSPTTNLTGPTTAQPTFRAINNGSTPVTTRYILTATNTLTGCTKNDTINVTVNPVGVGARLTTTFCSGSPATIGTPAQVNFTYAWTPTNIFVNNNVAQPTLINNTNTGSTPTVITAFRNATNTVNGCVQQDTVTITINPLPVANAGSDQAVCSGQATTLGTGSSAGLSYSWSPITGLNNPNASNPTLTRTNPGNTPLVLTYIVNVTNTATNCTKADTVVVTVAPSRVAASNIRDSVCSNVGKSIGRVSQAGFTYSWQPTTGLNLANISNPVLTVQNAGTTPVFLTYVLTATNNATTCQTLDTFIVKVNPLPNVALGNDMATCSGTNVGFKVQATASTNYTWSLDGGLAPGLTGILSQFGQDSAAVLLFNTTGSPVVQNIKLSAISNLTGCTNEDVLALTVNPNPVAIAANVDTVTICSRDTIGLGVAAVSGNTYAWSPATGLSATNVANPRVTLINTGATATLNKYYLTVTSAQNCVTIDSVVVRVNPQPVANVGSLDSLCSRQTITIGAPAVTGLAYTWSPATGLGATNVAQPTLTLVNTTQNVATATYKLVVTNTATGCKDSANLVVRVNPLPIAVGGADTAVCPGSVFTRGELPQVGYSYRWARISNPSGARFILSDSLVANPTFTVLNTGTNQVTLGFAVTKRNNLTGCEQADTVNLTSYPLPEAVASLTDTLVTCSERPLQLGKTSVVGVNYAWLPTTGLSLANISNPTLTLVNNSDTVQTFVYRLTTTHVVTNCVNQDSVVVIVNPLPKVTLPVDYTTCSGVPVTVGEPAKTGYTYAWSGSTFLSANNVAQPVYTRTIANGAVQATELLTLIITNATTLCADTFTTTVKVNSNPVVSAGPDRTICSNDTTVIGVAGGAGITYAWSPVTGIANPVAANTTVSLANLTNTPRVDTLILTATVTATGCQSKDTVLVTVNPRPLVSSIQLGSNTVCPDVQGVIYSVTAETGTTYNWTVDGGTIAAGQGTNQITVNWGPTNLSASVAVVATNSFNCSGDTITAPILVKIQLNPSKPTGDTVVCSASPVVNYTTGATVGSSYTWHWSYDSLGVTQFRTSGPVTNSFNIPWTTLGRGKVWVVERSITSSNTCEGVSDTTYIEVVPSPDSSKTITGPSAVCAGTKNVSFSILPTVGATYKWTLKGLGANVDTIATGQGTNAITFNATTADTLVITITETSDRGCVGKTLADTLFVNPLPVVLKGTVDSVCSGQPLVLGAAPLAQFSYKWTPATGLNDDTLANPTLVIPTAGSYKYYLTVTNRATGCNKTDSINVRVNALPQALAGNDVAICSGQTATLGAARLNKLAYAWTLVSGLQSGLTYQISDTAASNPAVRLTNSTNQPVWQQFALVVQDSLTKCFNYDTVTVKVNPLPIAIAYATDSVNICSGVATQLGSPAIDSLRYKWTVIPSSAVAGLNDDTLAAPTLTLVQTGTPLVQTYVVTVTNRLTGCVNTDTVVATINPLPVITVNRLDSICSGGSKQICATVASNVKVVWSPATGLSATNTTCTNVSLVNNGTSPIFQTYYVTATDTNTGCVNLDSVVIKVNPLPRAFAGNDQVVCSNSNVTLGEAAISGNTYSWQPANGLSGANLTVANPTIRVTTPGPNAEVVTYILTVTSPSGCIKTDTAQVTINPLPVVSLADFAVCSGSTATMSNIVANPALRYQWSPADSLADPTNPASPIRRTISGTTAQNFTYSLITTNRTTGCADTSDVVVTVNPLPLVDAGTGYAVCATNDSVRIGVLTSVAGQTYSWSVTNAPTGVVPVLGSSNVAQPNFGASNTTGQPQRVTLSVTVTTTATGCVNTDTTSVLVNPRPVAIANAAPTATICSRDTIRLGTNPTAGWSYSWSPATGLSNANVANPTITLVNPTQQVQSTRYTLTVTNIATNCSTTDTVRVFVNPLPIVNVGTVAATCVAVPAQIGAAPVAGYGYRWSPATGLDNAFIANPTITLATPQTLVYTLTVTNLATGCKDSSTLSFTVNPLPRAFAGNDQVACSNSNVTLGEAPVVGNVYSWQPANGLSGTNLTVANPTIRVTTPGPNAETVTYILTVTSPNGCIKKDTALVTINPLPVVTLTDFAVCSGSTAPMSNIVANPALRYQWTPADSLVDPTNPSTNIRRTITGTTAQTFRYSLITTNRTTGCADTSFVNVTVNPLPAVEAGSNYRVCAANDSVRVGTLAAVAGQTYNWTVLNTIAGVTPKLGSANSAQPNFGALNTTGQPQRVLLRVTVTTSATGCVNTDTTSVLVNPRPVAVANTSPTTTICSNGTAQLGAAPSAGYSYSWSPVLGLNQGNIANPTVTLTNTTQAVQGFTYTLTVTNLATGCTNTDTVRVIVNPLPLVNLGTVSSTCVNAPAVIGATPVPGYTYQWKPATGLSSAFVANPTVLFNSPQSISYRLVVTNAATGCKDSSAFNFTVNPLPTANAGANVAVCSGEPAQLGAAPVSGFTYSWSPANGLSSSAVANPTFNLSNTTGAAINLRYILTVTNASTLCASNDTVDVVLNPEPVTIRQAYDSTFCPQTATGRAYSVQGLPNSSYRWWVTGGTMGNGIQNGAIVPNNSITVNWDTTATSFGIKVLEVSNTLCQADTVFFPINFNSTTIQIIAVTQDPTLYNNAVAIRFRTIIKGGALAAGSRARVYRRLSGTGNPFDLIGNPLATDTLYLDATASVTNTQYDYYVAVDNACGTSTSSLPAQTNLLLQGEGDNADQTSKLTWTAYQGWAAGVARYEIYRKLDTEGNWSNVPYAIVAGNVLTWSARNGADAFGQTYRIVAVKNGDFSVRAQSNDVEIRFENALSQFNTITPNGDGRNDEFVIDNLALYGKHSLSILNRNGVQVYNTTDYKQDWKADNLPAGTYFYILKVEGERAQTIKGWIQVLK